MKAWSESSILLLSYCAAAGCGHRRCVYLRSTGKPQTSLSSASRVNTRPGFDAISRSSSYSLNLRSMRLPPRDTSYLVGLITSSPTRITSGSSCGRVRRMAHFARATNSAGLSGSRTKSLMPDETPISARRLSGASAIRGSFAWRHLSAKWRTSATVSVDASTSTPFGDPSTVASRSRSSWTTAASMPCSARSRSRPR